MMPTSVLAIWLIAAGADQQPVTTHKKLDLDWKTVPIAEKTVTAAKRSLPDGRGIESRHGPEHYVLTATVATDGRLRLGHRRIEDAPQPNDRGPLPGPPQ